MPGRKGGPPVITLTTDFGTSDHFVGVMKGVILGICPEAAIVDISHEVAPFQIQQGAFLIAQAWRWFPKGSVHVVIVDPGVGSSRRPVLMEAGGHRFIAPDNGVLAMVANNVEKLAVREITNTKLWLPAVSRTFHGRDVFAPSAAHLAAGRRPASFGKVIDDYHKSDFCKPQRTGRRIWSGAVLHVDRFGNLIANFHLRDFPDIRKRPFTLTAGTAVIEVLLGTYADASPGEIFALEGSSGFVEISARESSAARALGLTSGSPLELVTT